MEAKHLVRVLEVDPDLGSRLDPRSVDAARRFAVAEVRTAPAGAWAPVPPGPGEGDHLGLLILGGVVARTVTLCDRQGIELFGPGAVVNPWSDDGTAGALAFEETWAALDSTDFAVLDHSFLAVACRWPGLLAELMARGLRQSRELAFHRAIGGHAGLALRLQLLLWLLADRWGTVGPAGVEIPLKLSHDLLARLVGARRPSVSVAMGALVASGAVRRAGHGRWTLLGDPPPLEAAVAALEESCALSAVVPSGPDSPSFAAA